MADKTQIMIAGYRPWGQARSGISFRKQRVPALTYLKQLQLALKALYYHEEKKYEEWIDEEFCKCETPPEMTLDMCPPKCSRCRKTIPPVPRWKDKPCQSTLIAAEIPDANTSSEPTSQEVTQQEISTQLPVQNAENN